MHSCSVCSAIVLLYLWSSPLLLLLYLGIVNNQKIWRETTDDDAASEREVRQGGPVATKLNSSYIMTFKP